MIPVDEGLGYPYGLVNGKPQEFALHPKPSGSVKALDFESGEVQGPER